MVAEGTPASSTAPYSVYNIGHGSPINLMDFIKSIESELGIEAEMNFRGMQAVANLVCWYKEFYNK